MSSDDLIKISIALITVLGTILVSIITHLFLSKQNKTSLKAEKYLKILDDVYSKFHFRPAFFNEDELYAFVEFIDAKKHSGVLGELRSQAQLVLRDYEAIKDQVDKYQKNKEELQPDSKTLRQDYIDFYFLFEKTNKRYRDALGMAVVKKSSTPLIALMLTLLGVFFMFIGHGTFFQLSETFLNGIMETLFLLGLIIGLMGIIIFFYSVLIGPYFNFILSTWKKLRKKMNWIIFLGILIFLLTLTHRARIFLTYYENSKNHVTVDFHFLIDFINFSLLLSIIFLGLSLFFAWISELFENWLNNEIVNKSEFDNNFLNRNQHKNEESNRYSNIEN